MQLSSTSVHQMSSGPTPRVASSSPKATPAPTRTQQATTPIWLHPSQVPTIHVQQLLPMPGALRHVPNRELVHYCPSATYRRHQFSVASTTSSSTSRAVANSAREAPSLRPSACFLLTNRQLLTTRHDQNFPFASHSGATPRTSGSVTPNRDIASTLTQFL